MISCRIDRVSAAVSTNDGSSARPVTAALYRRWRPSTSSGPAGSPSAVVRVAMISGTSRLAVIAYPGSNPGPGPMREIVCGPLPGSRVSP